MKDLTIQEFSETIGIDYTAASCIVRLMKTHGLVEEVGVQRKEGTRGKGRKVYQFTGESFQELAQFLTTNLETDVVTPTVTEGSTDDSEEFEGEIETFDSESTPSL